MKAHQFLFEKGYTQKVRYPDGKEESSAFHYDTVVRLLNEYSEHLANGHESEQRQLTIPDVIRRHFDNDETYQNFINALDKMLGRVSFDSNRTINQAKGTNASMVLRFNKFKSLPDGEGYYLGINKMGTITLD
jgi:hypothetical protein